MADALRYSEFNYGSEHEQQRLGVWEFPPSTSSRAPAAPGSRPKYWIVYLHGGAFRDPRVLLASGLPTFNRLLQPNSPLPTSRIAGFASIDYRLSPHPLFPEPPDTPPSRRRAARHPDHIVDIWAGLAFLQRRYGFGADYLVVGHSAGGFLGLQLPMGRAAVTPRGGAPPDDVALPVCIVGVEGIYDLRGIAERADGGLDEILSGAFGTDRDLWDTVSPGRFRGFGHAWGSRKGLVVLAYSPEDELVDGGEIDTAEAVLRQSGVRVLAYRDLKGKHDEVREDGTEIARMLALAVEELDRSGKAALMEAKGLNMKAVQ